MQVFVKNEPTAKVRKVYKDRKWFWGRFDYFFYSDWHMQWRKDTQSPIEVWDCTGTSSKYGIPICKSLGDPNVVTSILKAQVKGYNTYTQK